jgi:hypothetical protein
MSDIDAYMAPVVASVVTPVVTRTKPEKRKRPEADSSIAQARLMCESAEEYLKVSNMNATKIEQFISEKQYTKSKQLTNTIFGAIHELIAIAADTVIRGDGHIKDEIMRDVSLKSAIIDECDNWASYLSNRWKIGILLSIDVFNGKRTCFSNQSPHIEEITDVADPVDLPQAVETAP